MIGHLLLTICLYFDLFFGQSKLEKGELIMQGDKWEFLSSKKVLIDVRKQKVEM